MFSDLTAAEIVALVISLIVSLSLHELMHGVVAYWLGDDTAAVAGRLTLNPLKHIDLYTTVLLPIVMIIVFHVPFLAAKPVPFNPYKVKFREYGAALVGLAGPLTNLALAVVVAIVFRLFVNKFSTTVAIDVYDFIYLNIAMCVFNLIPIPPLDGSRLLYAVAPEGLQNIMERIEGMGFTAIIFIMLIFFYLLSPLIISIDTDIIRFLLT